MTTPNQPVTRPALLNIAAAFVLAAIVNSLLHEGAHAVAGLAQGLIPTLTPFSVDYRPEPTVPQAIVTALAGPVFSLVLGVTLLAVARRRGHGFTRVFWLWLGFMGVMNFAGYLVIAPIVTAGDTARAMTLLEAPDLAFFGACVLGVGLQIGLAYLFAREVKRYTTDIRGERVLAFRAWGLGTLVVVVLAVTQLLFVQPPAEAVVAVAFYAVAVGVFAPMQFIFRNRVAAAPFEDLQLDRLSRLGLGVTAAAAVGTLVLAAMGGIRLG